MDLQEVSDRLEIRQLMDRYGMACDSCDWDLYRSLFTTDAVIDYTEFGGGRDGLDLTIEWLKGGLEGFVGLHHNMTNHYCEIDGDTARAVTYFLAYHAMIDESGGETVFEVGGFYKDRLRRQADGWRISERVDLGVWMKPHPALPHPPKWYGTMNHHKPKLLEG